MNKKVLSLFILLVINILITGCKKNNSYEENWTLNINVEGMGQIAYALDNEELIFNDEFPVQSAQIIDFSELKIKISAKPDNGYKFVKWVMDSKDYSTEQQIEIAINEDTELQAIFDKEE